MIKKLNKNKKARTSSLLTSLYIKQVITFILFCQYFLLILFDYQFNFIIKEYFQNTLSIFSHFLSI